MNNNKKITIMHLRGSQQKRAGLFGAESIVLDICRFLDKDLFAPVIVALKDKRAKGELPLVKAAKRYDLLIESLYLNKRFDLKALSKLKELIKKYKVDILHCHDYKSDLIGFLVARSNKDIKLISTLHGYLQVTYKVKIYELMDLFILRYFDRIITVSNFLGSLLRKKGYANKTSVIPNGVDYERFQVKIDRDSIKKELKIDKNALIIGTIGRLSPEKGHYYFLMAAREIFKDFKRVAFLIVGDGPLRSKLERLALKIGIRDNVIFTGFREDVNRLLSVIDIFVMPSIKEAFGLSILEAMAAGKAVIATNAGGMPSIIKDKESGILVSSRNSNVLAKAIINLLEDKSLRIELGQAAKDYVKSKFSINKMVKDYENVYLEILGK